MVFPKSSLSRRKAVALKDGLVRQAGSAALFSHVIVTCLVVLGSVPFRRLEFVC
jgi:hypothetical protein